MNKKQIDEIEELIKDSNKRIMKGFIHFLITFIICLLIISTSESISSFQQMGLSLMLLLLHYVILLRPLLEKNEEEVKKTLSKLKGEQIK